MHPFTCKACNWGGFPSFELVGTKMLARCMNDVCGQIDASVTPADMNTAIARKDGKDVVVSRGAAVQPAPLAKATPVVAAPEAAPKLVATPLNAIKAIKARRRWLKTEIKRLEALKAEDAQLAAAEHAVRAFKRADNVRPIRKGAS